MHHSMASSMDLIRTDNAVTHRKRTICVVLYEWPLFHKKMLGKGFKSSSDFEEIWPQRNFGGGIPKWKKW